MRKHFLREMDRLDAEVVIRAAFLGEDVVRQRLHSFESVQLTLYFLLGHFWPIHRKFPKNKGSMKFKNSGYNIDRELHKLSISKKNSLFRCSVLEIYDLQNR